MTTNKNLQIFKIMLKLLKWWNVCSYPLSILKLVLKHTFLIVHGDFSRKEQGNCIPRFHLNADFTQKIHNYIKKYLNTISLSLLPSKKTLWISCEYLSVRYWILSTDASIESSWSIFMSVGICLILMTKIKYLGLALYSKYILIIG